MSTKRTRSMEIQAIKQNLGDSPPPPPSGASIRDWFAGLALANPELMKDIPTDERAAEAVRLADELSRALAAPKVPSQESLAAPSEADMAAWDDEIVADSLKRKDTVRPGRLAAIKPPETRKQTKSFGIDTLAPKTIAISESVVRMTSRPPLPEPSTYSSLHDVPEE